MLNFRTKLTLSFGAFFILIALVSSLIIERQIELNLRERNGTHLFSISHGISSEVSQRLEERERELKLLASAPALTQENQRPETIEQTLNSLKLSHEFYVWIGIADAKGKITNGINKIFIGEDASNQPWFQTGKNQDFIGVHRRANESSTFNIEENQFGPFRFIDFATPIFDEKRQQRGVLAAFVSWAWLHQIINRLGTQGTRQQDIRILIVDEKNNVMYSSDNSDDDGLLSQIALDSTKKTLWDTNEKYQYSVTTIFTSNSPALNWKVLVKQPLTNIKREIGDLNITILQITLIALLFLFVFSYWIASQVSRPLEKLSNYADIVSYDKELPKFELPSPTVEIARLADSIHRMIERLFNARKELDEARLNLESTVAQRTTELKEANLRLELKADQLNNLARTDQLTHLANRRAADEELSRLWNLFRRKKMEYCAIMIDIDFFKKVNDSYGHDIGDIALSTVASILKGHSRKIDHISRFGGEEFLICLPGTDLYGAKNMAEKIRQAVEQNEIYLGLRVTISLGVASCDEQDENEMSIIGRADKALYEAKQTGRNRVCVAPSHKQV